MAGNTQMNDNERGVFSFLHGITGMLVAVVLLLGILGVMAVVGLNVQSAEATNYYSINTDTDGLRMIDNSEKQYQNYKLEKGE